MADASSSNRSNRRSRRTGFLSALLLGSVLFVLWLLLSGITKPLLIVLGLLSTSLVVTIMGRLGILDAEGVPLTVRFGRMAQYFGWLVVEVLKADWAVTKVILRDAPLRQQLIRVPATTRTDLGKVVYANSITLTPGTITVETEGDTFVVHALDGDFADFPALADMNDRVCATESGERAGRPIGTVTGMA